MRLRPRNVRNRLTLWYVTVTGVVLLLYLCAATLLQVWQLSRQYYHAEVQDVETVQGLLYFTPDANIALHQEFYQHPQSRLLLDRLMEVLDRDGHVLFRNEKLGARGIDGSPFPNEGAADFAPRLTRLSDGTFVLAISHVHLLQGHPVLIRLAYPADPIRQSLVRFVGLLLLALPLALVAAGFAGYRVAGDALDPIATLVRQTGEITASSLQARLPVANPEDELGQLTLVLNGLLARLELAFDRQKRFTSDASHELRTPLASIRSVGEVGLQSPHSPNEYRDIIGSMLEEVDRLSNTVGSLLAISRAEAGETTLHPTHFCLMDLVRNAVRIIGMLAEEKHQTIALSGDGTLSAFADSALLRQALLNILDNAVKYSPPGSRISVHVGPSPEADRSMVQVGIEDQGPGIPAASVPHVFDRFYRVDAARSSEPGGAGLGLAIAKWAVEANAGEIVLKTAVSTGAKFIVRVPAGDTPT
jgi:heavy metal sensor kinase